MYLLNRLSFLYFFGISATLFSKQNYVELKTKYSDSKIEISLGSQRIINVGKPINFTRKLHYTIDDTSFIVWNNKLTNKIEFYTIEPFKMIDSIDVSNLMLSEDNNVLDIIPNKSTVIIVTKNYLHIIDRKGTILYSEKINDYNNSKQKYYYGNIYNCYESYIYGNILYMYESFYKGPQNLDYFNKPIEVKFDLENKTKVSNTIYQSKLLQNKKINYGLVRNASKISHDSIGVITFQNDANIYQYNYVNNKMDTFCGKSSYQIKPIASLSKKYFKDQEIQFKHYSHQPWYTNIVWDPYRKCYFRFYLQERLKNDSTQTNSSFLDRHLIMMLFNDRFELINEKDVGQYKQFGYGYLFITKNNIYLQEISNYMNKSVISLKEILLKK